MTNGTGGSVSFLSIDLEEGTAENMGCGTFIVVQRNEGARKDPWQSVVVTPRDLETLQSAEGLTVELEDGAADNAGCGIWRIRQRDDRTGKVHAIILTANDAKAMQAAA